MAEGIHANIPVAFQDLFRPARYKVWHSGRGAAKSWSFARALAVQAHQRKLRIGCFRELQNSIRDSVHRLLHDQIYEIGLGPWYNITQQSITHRLTGSEFIFKGLRHNASEIKSTEGIDIGWVEEAQLVSKDSWELLTPTIRKEGSEIWVSLNPIEETDATYQKFVVKPPPGSIVRKVSWRDNPFFPKTLNEERLYMLKVDPEAYEHVWEGECRTISEAVIFKGRYVVEPFETPTDPPPRFYHGADFGFSQDAATLMRMYITEEKKEWKLQDDRILPPGEHLWIDREAYGVGVELNELAKFYDSIDTSRAWPIKADNSRPETISYVRNQGFNISPAEKWQGSVEDGIAHLKAFVLIHIHEQNCRHQAIEARLYKYKVDKNTNEVLPIIVDKHNHCWDGVRYGLDGLIHRRGDFGLWKKAYG